MIFSLTGFGRADVEDGDLHYSVEVRSVNNRYLEVSTKLPRTLLPFEMDLRTRIRNRIDRGKVNVFIQESRDTVRLSKMHFDGDAAERLVEGLRGLAQRTGLRDDLSIGDLIHLIDWLNGDENEDNSERRMALAAKGIDAALNEFERMRGEEGSNLEADFRHRLDLLAEISTRIEGKSNENREGALVKLRDRIEKYIPAEKVDEGRLEQEVAYLVDRLDITEELVRLRSHIQLFQAALDEGGTVGKRLNFILQEMNREVNTIGSKASDADIASWVVEAKEELEKMREQVQNVA